MKILNGKYLIVLICLIALSCSIENEVGKHKEESINILSVVINDLKDTPCAIVLHSYGEYMTPIITKNNLEKEIRIADIYISHAEVKRQSLLAKDYSENFLIFKEQIVLDDFLNVIKGSEQSSANAWDEIAKKFGCVKGISIPIFSENYKYAYVYEYSIYGKLQGGGSCRIYRKEKDKWTLVKVFNEWIS